MYLIVLVLALGVIALGLAGFAYIPTSMSVGWAALFSTIVAGLLGLWFFIWLIRKLLRLSIGTAIAPAQGLVGKLIAITFATIMVPTIPWFLWDVFIRVLNSLFGRNPGYENLPNLARLNCALTDQTCIMQAVEGGFGALVRFFRNLLDELNLGRLPLLDLFWFLVAALAASCAFAIVRSHVRSQPDGTYSLESLGATIPRTVRDRIPVAILLLVAFYFALSAMFAIPVLRGARDIVVDPKAIAERLAPSGLPADRLKKLGEGLSRIEFNDPARGGGTSTPPAAPLPAEPAPQPAGTTSSGPDRNQTARSYADVYDRQREEFMRALEESPTWLAQLAAGTTALATSSSRPFLGVRDRDRYVTAVIDHYRGSMARYEAGLYACRRALIELREEIERFRTTAVESPTLRRLFGFAFGNVPDLDRRANEAVRVCQAANNPEPVEPRLPPDPFEILGPFGANVRWLTATDSRAIATIVGMIGFGLLGATLSRMIRKSESAEGKLIGVETFFVVASGVTAALVVYLGSYAVLGEQSSESNPYIVFVTCLVGAVFSEDIWAWAREKFTPKKEGKGGTAAAGAEAREPAGEVVRNGETAAAAQAAAEPAQPDAAAAADAQAAGAAATVPGAAVDAPQPVADPGEPARTAEGSDWERYKR